MSLTQCLHRGLNMHGDKNALVYGDRSTTYRELHQQVSTCAGILTELGFKKEERIGILSMNNDRAIVCFYGAIWAGMTPNYLNIRWSLHELVASVDDCAASILFADETFLATAIELRNHCKSVREVVYIGDPKELPEGVLCFNELMKSTSPIADSSSESDQTAFINYTGGTTGKGKGVVHTHSGHTASFMMLHGEGFLLPGTFCMVMPLFHIGGITLISSSLALGNTIIIVPNFDPLLVFDLIQKHHIKVGFFVPTMLKMLVDHPHFSEQDLTCLEHIRYGASPMDETLMFKLKDSLPWIDFRQIYGQTEGLPATILHDSDHSTQGAEAGRTRSAGTPCYGIDIKIRNAEGEALPVNEIGEVTLRGPHIMKEYWNNPEQTAAALQNGWLFTGDAGYLSEEGYLYIVDRIKDMIISGGENIYSAEVENAICKHAAVQQCAVVGLPDEKWGETVHAEIVLNQGMTLTAEGLNEFCRDFLAGYKLARSVEFVDALPLTAVGKIDKIAIRNKNADST